MKLDSWRQSKYFHHDLKFDGRDTNRLSWNAGLPHAATLGQVLQSCIPANKPLGATWEDTDDIFERLITSARSLRSSPATHFQKAKSSKAELIWIQRTCHFPQIKLANKAG